MNIACLHPIKAWEDTRKKTKNGRKVITFKDPKKEYDWSPGIYKEIQIACGQCTECRLAYRRHWATRLMLEKKSWTNRYFITLTYDDDKAHWIPIVDESNGEIHDQTTLNKKDWQDFMKRWTGAKRSNWKCGKRKYFATGEYGEVSGRAHMHRIIFQKNPIPDLKFYKYTRDHLPLFTSELLDKKWGKGMCFIGEVTLESRGYVARYIMKKQKGEGAEIYDRLQIEPEFVCMSNGIGMAYFEENYEAIYENDQIILPSYKGEAKKLRPPRRYDEAIWKIAPNILEEKKEQRLRNAQAVRNHKQAQTSREDWAEIERRSRQQKQKILKRGDI